MKFVLPVTLPVKTGARSPAMYTIVALVGSATIDVLGTPWLPGWIPWNVKAPAPHSGSGPPPASQVPGRSSWVQFNPWSPDRNSPTRCELLAAVALATAAYTGLPTAALTDRRMFVVWPATQLNAGPTAVCALTNVVTVLNESANAALPPVGAQVAPKSALT